MKTVGVTSGSYHFELGDRVRLPTDDAVYEIVSFYAEEDGRKPIARLRPVLLTDVPLIELHHEEK